MSASLPALLTRRLALVAALGFLAQGALVVRGYVADPDELREDAVERVLDAMAGRLDPAGGLPGFAGGDHGYAHVRFAVLDPAGAVVAGGEPGATARGADLREAMAGREGPGGPVWQGARRVLRHGREWRLWAELSFHGPGMPLPVLLAETTEDLAWPALPLLAALLLANVLVARLTVRGLGRAAAEADRLGGDRPGQRLDPTGLPRETAALVEAVNRGLGRLDAALERQGRFNADAAHELRTPLATLLLELEAVGGELGARLRGDVAALARRVGQLLEVSRLGTLRVGPGDRADLAAIAVAAVGRLAPLAVRDGKALALEGPAAGVPVRGDAEAIAAALANLVDNALRAGPPGGTVTVGTGPGASLWVADEGPGIPPALRDAVLRRHWQADRARGAAGLGLAIVRETMAAHGGRVLVGEARPRGALVRLEFPTAG